MARLYPDIRIASLRFSALRDDRSSAKSIGHRDLFAYSMTEAVARACLAGISSDKFNGHEVFYAIAPDIAYEHLPEDDATWDKFGLQGDKRTSLELLAKTYPGTKVREGWWVTGQERRGFFDCSKAEQLLDWKHDV
jgi:UDP-glucose 4-epimerase